MKRILMTLIIAASLSLAGCVTIGKTFPVDKISKIEAAQNCPIALSMSSSFPIYCSSSTTNRWH